MDIDQLINEVYTRRPLWDKTNKQHHDRFKIEKLWMEISKEMKIPKNDLKKKWKYLRDQFRMETRKIPVARSGDAGDASNYTATWAYYSALRFLSDQVICRKSSGNLKTLENSEITVDDVEDATIALTNAQDHFEDFEIIDISPEPIETPTKKKTNKSTNSYDKVIQIEQRKLELLEKKINKTAVRDEDEGFFDSLLPHIRKLEPAEKFCCRMDIQNLIYNYVYKSNNSERNTQAATHTYTSTPVSSNSGMHHILSLSPELPSSESFSSPQLFSQENTYNSTTQFVFPKNACNFSPELASQRNASASISATTKFNSQENLNVYRPQLVAIEIPNNSTHLCSNDLTTRYAAACSPITAYSDNASALDCSITSKFRDRDKENLTFENTIVMNLAEIKDYRT